MSNRIRVPFHEMYIHGTSSDKHKQLQIKKKWSKGFDSVVAYGM